MKIKLLLFVFVFAYDLSSAQISFSKQPSQTNGQDSTRIVRPSTRKGSSNQQRLPEFGGLLAPKLGKDPVTGEDLAESKNGQYCCCTSSTSCPAANIGVSPSNLGVTSTTPFSEFTPTSKFVESTTPFTEIRQQELPSGDTSIRIINLGEELSSECPLGSKICCYPTENERDSVQDQCSSTNSPTWRQLCPERGIQDRTKSNSLKQCGERFFKPLPNLQREDASPNEFPWACLVLNGKNDFIAGCVIVPESPDNDISSGTKRVITVAHRIKSKVGMNDQIKVRIGEYDASTEASPQERYKSQEFEVSRIVMHPDYNNDLFTNNIARLEVATPINLYENPSINAACFPACNDMFDFKFDNGTGTRCWLSGWGKNSSEGDFSFTPRKVDLPLVDRQRCNKILRSNLEGQDSNPRSKNFELHEGELCAGGFKDKDACEGDGGAPLVCRSETGHWHVVGLVAWGLDCGLEGVPGVYTNVFHYQDFIFG